MSNSDKMFYRVRASVDPNNGGFLVSPQQYDAINQIDGVCFAFDLSQFSSLPSKIRIFQRAYDTGEPWTLIGAITEFDERMGVKFMRGSAVWLPQAEGYYEVQAAVVDSTGAVVASAIRRITINQKQPPTISIVSGPASSASAIPLAGSFALEVGDTVRRVEFYDNGKLIGTATQEEFEDTVRDLQGREVDLFRGSHSIVARAYDSTGAFADSDPYNVSVTGGNARPELTVTAPIDDIAVVVGDSFNIVYDPPTDPDGFGDIVAVRASRYIIPFASSNNPSQPEEVIAQDSSAPFEQLVVNTTSWNPGAYTIKVVAVDTAGEESYPHYFRVYVKSSSSADFAGDLFAELESDQSLSFLDTNFVGREMSSGIFEDGHAFQLQIDSGVLLTTGDFNLWNAGNLSDEAGLQLSARGDFDLENRVAGSHTQDAAVLECEIFCENGQLEIEYQFGSEEYHEFVGEFNDAFMIIVNGAVVTRAPDCANIVAVNTVNLDQNRHLFIGNNEDIDPTGILSNKVEYDGLTVRMRVHVFVEPQSINTVRIVIADVNDGILDSGIFLESGSFKTTIPTP